MDLVTRAMGVIETQHTLIEEWQWAYDAQRQRLTLEHTRNVRDLVQGFLEAQERGVDVTEELEKGLCDLKDHVARLEEQCR